MKKEDYEDLTKMKVLKTETKEVEIEINEEEV